MSGSPSGRVGPYRFEGSLGAGGMGEVYRAWDERLERWVAIKRIRPEAEGSDTARERFRREARAAAGLSHSAIVQIFDVLEWDGGEAIVMELVEGTSLDKLLQKGPLDLRTALRVAREVAEGLAAAHARGILHRDLKAENVVVTAEGHAKILDFGLAKRLGATPETALTRDHIVVGTSRSMSPEQARGLALDARSDLFSFGVLLYEMLSGVSPFLGETPMDTLARICTARQKPVRDLGPGIPGALSDIVDRLLEKDPGRRPQTAREVAEGLESFTGWMATPPPEEQATRVDGRPSPASSSLPSLPPYRRVRRRWLLLAAAVLLLVVAGLLWRSPPPASEERKVLPGTLFVAVSRPEIGLGRGVEDNEILASGLRIALLRGLLSLRGLSPIAAEQVDEVSGPPVTLARALAADEVITSRLDCRRSLCQVSLYRIQGKDGRLLWTQSFEAPVDRPLLAAEAIQDYLRRAYPRLGVRPGFPKLEIRGEDYRKFLEILRIGDTVDTGPSRMDAQIEKAAEIRRNSPGFLDTYVLEASLLRSRFFHSRDPADLERAFELLRQARSLAPTDPRPLLAEFEAALAGERLDQAERTLADLQRLQPGEPGILVARARLLERHGKAREALLLLRQAVEQRPARTFLNRLANLEYRLGETGSARRHLEEILRRSPGHYATRSLLAQIELSNGDPRRAAELYEAMIRQQPGFEVVTNLGVARMLLHEHPQAEAHLRRAVEMEPQNPGVLLNLADVVLLQGRKQEAEGLYRRTLDLSERDPAPTNWQLHTIRAQALAHLGARSEAVETIQKVLALEDNQAAAEAALVYALVGDEASAVVNARRAAAQGIAPSWFALPWFDPLRSSAEFRRLLTPQRNPGPSLSGRPDPAAD